MTKRDRQRRINLRSKRCALSARASGLENAVAEFDIKHPIERLVIDCLLRKRDDLSAEIVAIDRALGEAHPARKVIQVQPDAASDTNIIALCPPYRDRADQ